MNKRELTGVLDELGLFPSRRLGQNFLVDTNLLQAIVRTADPQPGETILEVGPGTGALTEHLLNAGADVIAIEYDRRLAEYLGRRFADHGNLTLIQGDACRQDYDTLLEQKPFRCVANLPYSCSSPFLGELLEMVEPPLGCLLLLQREMGLRLTAAPGTKTYGALSVRVSLLYDVTIERAVGRTVFHPQPEVDSALVKLTRHHRISADLRPLAARLARITFSQRRKRAQKLLEGQFPKEQVAAAFASTGFSPNIRAEHISVDGFVALAACLQS